MQPDEPIARSILQNFLISRETRDEQLAHQRRWIADDPEGVAAFERGLAEAGHEGVQGHIADLLAARYERAGGVVPLGLGPVFIAARYLAAGGSDRAIAWLERAFEERNPNLPYVGRLPFLSERLRPGAPLW